MGRQHPVVFLSHSESIGPALHPPVGPESLKQAVQKGGVTAFEKSLTQTLSRRVFPWRPDKRVAHRSSGSSPHGHRRVLDASGDGRQRVLDKGLVVFKLALDGIL